MSQADKVAALDYFVYGTGKLRGSAVAAKSTIESLSDIEAIELVQSAFTLEQQEAVTLSLLSSFVGKQREGFNTVLRQLLKDGWCQAQIHQLSRRDLRRCSAAERGCAGDNY